MSTQILQLSQNQQSQNNYILQLLCNQGDMVRTNTNKLKPANTMKNCELILSNDPLLVDCFRLNVFSHKWEVIKPLPWEHTDCEFKIREWMDADDNELISYMEQFQIIHCKQTILDSLSNIFNRNPYHPVKEYLETK